MSEIFYDLTTPHNGMNYRWVQPPQIAYFVTTIDAKGNPNSTPVTLGTCVGADMEADVCGNYFFVFSVGCQDLPGIDARHAHHNLEEVPECVISYIGAHLVRESQIACCPLPKGISEIDVAGLTELPSRKVRPPGIAECGVNIECEVVSSTKIGKYYRLYICRVLGVSVGRDLVEKDHASTLHAGTLITDPLFEVNVLGATDAEPPRLCYMRLDPASAERMPGDIGSARSWIGSFEEWMEDEVGRGSLSESDKERILSLHAAWKANPDPRSNGEAKSELTDALKRMLKPRSGK